MIFHFCKKSHFGVQSAHYFCSHELRLNETQNGMDFISVILTEMKFQTGMRFSCEHNLPEKKWISADSLDVAYNAHVRLKLSAGVDFMSVILTEMKFHFGWWNSCEQNLFSRRFGISNRCEFISPLMWTYSQSLTKFCCITVFKVGGCLASCLTFRPFLTLDSSQYGCL